MKKNSLIFAFCVSWLAASSVLAQDKPMGLSGGYHNLHSKITGLLGGNSNRLEEIDNEDEDFDDGIGSIDIDKRSGSGRSGIKDPADVTADPFDSQPNPGDSLRAKTYGKPSSNNIVCHQSGNSTICTNP